MKKKWSTSNAEPGRNPLPVVTSTISVHLPAAVADGVVVAASPAATTSATATATTATATSPAATAAAAATVAAHLVQAGVDLLLSFLENVDEITGLLGVYASVSSLSEECS